MPRGVRGGRGGGRGGHGAGAPSAAAETSSVAPDAAASSSAGTAASPAGTRRGRSAKAKVSDEQLCGTCGKDGEGSFIGCDGCQAWVHCTEMCCGLSCDMIQAIEKYEGAGIMFICTKCRLDFSLSAWHGGSHTSSTETQLVELVKHLSQQLHGMSSVVQQLKAEIGQIRAGPPPDPSWPSLSASHPPAPDAATPSAAQRTAQREVPRPPPDVPPASASSEYRKVVREELRELQEQQKRRSSLVIRGLGAHSANAAIQAFEQVTDFLIHQRVSLTDVVRIPSETDLYRGKVCDDDARKLILDRAKQLKDSDRFGSVFIRRDLTYKQRSELQAKRAATETGTASNPPHRSADSRRESRAPEPTADTSVQPARVRDGNLDTQDDNLPAPAPPPDDHPNNNNNSGDVPDPESNV